MARFRNQSTIPQGMLAPSGLDPTLVDAGVQATTRPAGTLLVPSPGFDTIRRGKLQKFQGGQPSGGFNPMEFAEDVGGSGVALSVVPGDTTAIEASEWLAESPDSLPPGDMIIADRGSSQEPGFATRLHEAYETIPDMGDRTRGRPLSRAQFKNPVAMLRQDWADDPGLTVLGCAALVTLIHILGRDLEGNYRRYRGRGVATAVTAAPAAAAETSGDVTAGAVDDIGKAADKAVEKISKAADDAVETIKSTVKDTTETVTE